MALDRSDPRTNGHAYVVHPAARDPLGLRLSEGSRRGVAAALVAAAFAALCLARARRRARLMNQAWPAGRAALVLALPGFVHLTHYRSADEALLGYRFVNEHTAEQLRAGFRSADAVWIDPRGMYARGTDRVLREAGSSLEEQLQQHGFKKQLVLEDCFELWTKGP